MSRIQARLSRFLPLESLFNYFDLKLGSEILTYFALFNKVAGFYGLLAIFFGGNALFLDQLLLYLYNIASIGGIVWGLRGIWDENAPQTLLYAHLYSIDHIVSTLSTLYFAIQWYLYTPHDGRRVANSEAQKAILEGLKAASDRMGIDLSGTAGDSDAERAAKALAVWRDERGFSTMVLVIGWLIKIYFIVALYSYAHHLRRGTWRQLIASQQAAKQSHSSTSASRRGSAMNGGYLHLRNTSTASAAYSTNSVNGGGPDDGVGLSSPDVLWQSHEGEEAEGEQTELEQINNNNINSTRKPSATSNAVASSSTSRSATPASNTTNRIESSEGQGDIGASSSPRMNRLESLSSSNPGSRRGSQR